jgi:glycosyltransferase involved in cell wall biosynthesis
MRIVIDLQSCQSGSRLGGIGRYSLELAKAMVRLADEDEFLIVLNDRNPTATAEIRREFRDLLPPDNIRIFAIPERSSFLHDGGAMAEAAELLREQLLVDLKPDFVHVTSLFEGLLDEVVTSVRTGDTPIPTAVTLYDLIPIKQKDLYLGDARAREHYFGKFEQIKKADVLLAISDFSAREGLELIGDFKGVVTDIRGGIDESFRPVPGIKARISEFLERNDIGDKFLLYTASFDQRKNQKKLIEAFAALPASVRKGHQLVIVGNGWPTIYHELKSIAAERGLADKDVIFPGRVSDEELIGLYNLCKLFVFPSLWEGLGMPVLEAMACGAPVIGSNTTSVPEVLGWEDASFDPHDVTSITAKLQQALTDKKFYAQLKAHAAKHSQEFTWRESARRSLEAMRKAHELLQAAKTDAADDATPAAKLPAVVSKRRYEEQRVWEIACCLAANELETDQPSIAKPKLKIGWVSSWGYPCGIASYSENLLRHIDHDIHILASDVHGGAVGDPDHVTRCWLQGKEQELRLLSATIDELDLTDIVIQFNYGFFNFQALNELMEEQAAKGRRIYITLHSTHDPQDAPNHRLADLRRGLSMALAVIVHADHDVERLAAISITSNVIQVPQGVRLLDTPAKPVVAGGPEVIASYGFFLPNKGLPELIEALALIRKTGRNVVLKMVNADYGDAGGLSRTLITETKARAKALGVTKHISFLNDYLDDAESLELLRDADLITYAYQQTGESSSAAVRMGLASGVPVAVTPLAIFNDVADATFRLPGVTPESLAAGIVEVLDRIKAGGTEVETRAENAAAWCASHDVRSVAAHTRRIIERNAATEVWQKAFENTPAKMLSRDGVVEGDRLKSNQAQGGLLTYGPYVSLPPGLYRLRITGDALGGPDGQVGVAEVLCNFGTVLLERFEISTRVDGVVLDKMLRLNQTAENLELVVQYAAGATLELSGYQFTRSLTTV